MTDSKKRRALINPYTSKKVNTKISPEIKLEEEASYQKYITAQKYLIFFRMKNDFMVKIIKSFTDNPYPILKNVYKYILMFLSVCSYISKHTENLMDIKLKQVMTPEGIIKYEDIAEVHKKEW